MSERDLEEEYFAKEDREKLAKLKAKADAEKAEAEKEERKALHWNRCGKCGQAMDTKPFRGIEIEVCPDCNAVLLDPGELEKLAGEDQGGIVKGLLSIWNRE
ncbi:MAG: zf-TFIIB domain-containing protein [Myxococcota bacterium]